MSNLSRIVLICLLIVLVFSGPVLGYGAWLGGTEQGSIESLNEIIAGLESSITRAERGNSARPNFILDLQYYLGALKAYRDVVSLPVIDPLEAVFNFRSSLYDRALGGFRDLDRNYTIIFRSPVTVGTLGRFEGLRFPSTNHGGAILTADLSQFQELTLEMNVYLDDFGPVEDLGYARLITTSNEEDFDLMMMVNTGPRYNRNSLVIMFSEYRVSTESNSIQLGRWHNIKLIHDGETLSVLIDGKEQRLTVESGSPQPLKLPQSVTYFIGNNHAQDRRLRGMISDLTIRNTARSGNDIQIMSLPNER